MRVLQVHNYYRFRGGECVVVDEERRLLEAAGHRVRLFSASSAALTEKGSHAKALTFLTMHDNTRVAGELGDVIRSFRPDVCHVHNVYPLLGLAVYRVLRGMGVPSVQTVHNYRFVCPNGLLFVGGEICEDCRRRRFFSAVRKRCLHGSIPVSAAYAHSVATGWRSGLFLDSISVWIALNRFGASRLVESGVPAERIRIVGNFTNRFPRTADVSREHFLYLARLSPEKGIRTLLAAAEADPGTRLVIAGAGPLAAEIEGRLRDRRLSHVRYLGHVDDTGRDGLLARTLALICPSEWYENFPLSVVEALAAGTPVIASRIGGLPEMVEDGRTGLLFHPGSVDELALAMKRISSDAELRESMGREALALASRRFSPATHLEGLLAAFAQAVSSSGPPA